MHTSLLCVNVDPAVNPLITYTTETCDPELTKNTAPSSTTFQAQHHQAHPLTMGAIPERLRDSESSHQHDNCHGTFSTNRLYRTIKIGKLLYHVGAGDNRNTQ